MSDLLKNPKLCGACDKPGCKLKCACKLVFYCGAECQRKDWKQLRHKRVCNTIVGVRRGEVRPGEPIKQNHVEEVRGLVLSGTVEVNDT